MKPLLSLAFLCCSFSSFAQNQSVGIGTTTPNASAALDVSSTEKGMLVPRMTSQQRTQISNAATGLLVFDNTTSSFWFRSASGWVELVDSTKQPWKKAGTNLYVNNGENVGIGTTTPAQKLEVAGTVKATEFFATPTTGGIVIGPGTAGATRLLGGISSVSNGYGYLQSIYADGSTWGNLALNANGGSVGVGTTAPAAKLHVAGSGLFDQGLVIDGNNANNGDGVNILRFGSSTSGEGIGSKRTATGSQNGLDLYAGGSRRLSVTNTGDVTIGTGTPSGRLTVAGNIVALDGYVKQKVSSWDVPNMTPGTGRNATWTHNLGYQPVIMITPQLQSGSAYGVTFTYTHLNNNQIEFRCRNSESFYDADIILNWIIVN